MKGLEALQDLSKLIFIYGGVEQYKIIEKELKALEIIKTKKVAIKYVCGEPCLTPQSYLTDEEYDLLKEELL